MGDPVLVGVITLIYPGPNPLMSGGTKYDCEPFGPHPFINGTPGVLQGVGVDPARTVSGFKFNSSHNGFSVTHRW